MHLTNRKEEDNMDQESSEFGDDVDVYDTVRIRSWEFII